MSLINNLLSILEQNRNTYISGQELAEKLGVSRTGIWKAIKRLEEDGYMITGVNNKGYMLSGQSDLISAEGISIYLDEVNKKYPIEVFKSVDSTNTMAKKLSLEDKKSELIIIADEQTAGRGRMGRNFFSPPKTGIYMSLVLRPNRHISELATITVKVCVAICRVIDRLTNLRAEIKWVNDIYINGKKVGGILTEAVTDFESGMVESVIIGIGLNIKTEDDDFPSEISSVAGSIFPGNVTRNEIIGEIINEFMQIYLDVDNDDASLVMGEYKERCFLLGRNINYYISGKKFEGEVVDINDLGNLVIVNVTGEKVILNSGEVTLSGN
ncbi:MAG: biotin--[acetyl-CoA-carboxylase] ligase [Firmicutes bacterium]|nr:biotin--[acetyl-CoA-carboxylase] ligase [Bacillota bacterium]